MPHDIITVGSATRDVFLISQAMHPHRAPDALTHLEACFPFGAKIGIDEIHFDTGGGATNNAVTFARLARFKVGTFCRVGEDGAGRDIMSALKKDHVDTVLVQTARSDQTAYSTILSPGGEVGERTILVYRGASEKFEHRKIPWGMLKAPWFYISSLGGDLALLRKLLSHAKKIGAQVAFNPGGQELKQAKKLKPLLKHLTFLNLNREEAARLIGVKFENTKELLRALACLTQNAVMTDGPKGAYAVLGVSGQGLGNSQSKRTKPYTLNPTPSAFYVPSVGHKPKNITGAGDAFGSAFITGWIKSRGNIREALRVGSFNADSVVRAVGAKNGILTKYPSKQQMARLPVREINL